MQAQQVPLQHARTLKMLETGPRSHYFSACVLEQARTKLCQTADPIVPQGENDVESHACPAYIEADPALISHRPGCCGGGCSRDV